MEIKIEWKIIKRKENIQPAANPNKTTNIKLIQVIGHKNKKICIFLWEINKKKNLGYKIVVVLKVVVILHQVIRVQVFPLAVQEADLKKGDILF